MTKNAITLGIGSLVAGGLVTVLVQYLDQRTRASCADCLHYGGPRVWSYDVTRYLAAGGTTGMLTVIWQQLVNWWGRRRRARALVQDS